MAIVWLLAAALSVVGICDPGSPGYVALGETAVAPAFVSIYPRQW